MVTRSGPSPSIGSRSRRRPAWARWWPYWLGLGVATLGILIAGVVAQYGPATRSYDSNVDASFAALASGASELSDMATSEMNALLSQAPGTARLVFFGRLGAIQTAASQATADLQDPSPPAGAPGAFGHCQTALRWRAKLAGQFADALRTLLGGSTGFDAGDQAAATSALVDVGTGLLQSDTQWAACRRVLARAPGHPRLARSVSEPEPGQWSEVALGRAVARMMGSANLAVHRRLVLTWSTEPPTVASSGAVGIVPATKGLELSVDVVDDGDVAEAFVVVMVTVTPLPSTRGAVPAPAQTRTLGAKLQPGGAQSFGPLHFAVTAGDSYDLVVRASGAGPVSAPPLSARIQVASGTVPSV